MNYFRKLSKYLLIAGLALSVFPSVAYAYLDPGTGSYVFQVLVGAVLGGVFALKMFWKSIRAYLSNLFGKEKAGE